MLEPFVTWKLQRERKRLLQSLPDNPLRNFLQAPLPDVGKSIMETGILALDLETTGLDPNSDEIIAVGFVPIDQMVIRLAGAQHILVRPVGKVQESAAAIHGILESHLREAEPLQAIFPRILQALQGRVLLAHHAKMELTFLNAACRTLYNGTLPIRTIDTLLLEKRRLQRQGKILQHGDLRLATCRQRRSLPRYKAHDALLDAIACGELFLTQAKHAGNPTNTPLKDFLIL
ncbi:MAG: DNA polymerase III subunit epsilon [Magnetococcales bacterium]|nr:DNA polymerase III subunit epsilon [Magnetococcales bacterium]